MSFMRRHDPKYSYKNGFDEVTKRFPTESLKEGEATENQDLARFVIREMGSFFPSLEEMREEVQASEGPETLANIQERIRRSKRENREDLAKLSRYYVQGLYDDAIDRYCQTDDIKYHDFEDEDFGRARKSSGSGDEWAEHYARIEDHYHQYGRIFASEHNDLVARMHYEHLRGLLPMYSRRREVERKEEIERLIQAAAREGAAHFPQSIKEYRVMSVSGRKELQMLIARFLIASETNQGLLRTRCRWTRGQTAPLISEYKTDPAFRNEVEAFVEGRDPRIRRTGEL